MFYLLLQTWIGILAAGLFGLFVGWLIWGWRSGRDRKSVGEMKRALSFSRNRLAELEVRLKEAGLTDLASSGEKSVDGSESVLPDDWRPVGLDAPRSGGADDLKKIRGIGPVLERTLYELGIYHFDQVAEFTEENVRWIDHTIAFPGRVKREKWVQQATKLAGGESTEYSERYDTGGKSGK